MFTGHKRYSTRVPVNPSDGAHVDGNIYRNSSGPSTDASEQGENALPTFATRKRAKLLRPFQEFHSISQDEGDYGFASPVSSSSKGSALDVHPFVAARDRGSSADTATTLSLTSCSAPLSCNAEWCAGCPTPPTFSLPLLQKSVAKHADLPSISADTVRLTAFIESGRHVLHCPCLQMNRLIAGEYADIVEKFTIIDCRFPYEYEAGHIQGAINIFEPFKMKEVLFAGSSAGTLEVPCEPVDCSPGPSPSSHLEDRTGPLMLRAASLGSIAEHLDAYCADEPSHSSWLPGDSPLTPALRKRNIVLFHCEFSHSRGPTMMRMVRNYDRQLHAAFYPRVAYPELYLVDRGYCCFFERFAQWCAPQAYLPMVDNKYAKECVSFRRKVEHEYYKFSANNKRSSRNADANAWVDAAGSTAFMDDDGTALPSVRSLRVIPAEQPAASTTMLSVLSPSSLLRSFDDMVIQSPGSGATPSFLSSDLQ
jgi:rhodanese-related sulfurtransferase